MSESPAAEQRFYHHAIAYLKEAFPEKTEDMEDSKIKETIDEGCAKANRYKIETEKDVMGFIDIQWRTDFDFDEKEKWAGIILKNKDFTASDKIFALRDAYCSQIILDGKHE